MSKKMNVIKILSFLLILLLLVGCGSDQVADEPATVDDGNETANTDADDNADADDSMDAEEPMDEILYGGTLVATTGSGGPYAVNFNPFAPGRVNLARNMIYEPLLLFDSAHPTVTNYWLAEDYSLAEDLTSITFILRQGVLWNDGETFDADDVVFTFGLFQEFPGTDFYAVGAYLDSVEKIDQYTVKVNLTQPMALAPMIIGAVNIVPEHAWADVEDPVLFTNETPVATGPYANVKTATPEVMEFCKHEDYWQEGKPYMDCIRFRSFNSNDTADLALINGEIEWANAFIADIENTYVGASEHNNIADWTNGLPVNLYLNHTKPPMSDFVVRKAVSQAINFEELLTLITDGRSTPATPSGLQLSLADAWLSDAAVAKAEETGWRQYNPDAAAAALEAAGYVDVDGDGFREFPDGSPMVVGGAVVGSWTDFVGVLQYVSQYLQLVGIKYEINAADIGQVVGGMMMGGYDTAIWFGTSGASPWQNYRNQMYSPLITENGAMGTAYARWSDPRTDELLDAFIETADVDEQFEILEELQLIYVENGINLPLFTRFTTYEYNTARFTGFPTNDNYYASGAPAGEEGRLLVLTSIHCKEDLEVCK